MQPSRHGRLTFFAVALAFGIFPPAVWASGVASGLAIADSSRTTARAIDSSPGCITTYRRLCASIFAGAFAVAQGPPAASGSASRGEVAWSTISICVALGCSLPGSKRSAKDVLVRPNNYSAFLAMSRAVDRKTYWPGEEVMLAREARDADLSRVAGWLASEKLDGIRCLYNGEAMITRSSPGKPPKQFTSVPEWFMDALPPGVTLDGEIWAGRGRFQDVSGISNAKDASGGRWETVRYGVFDSPAAKGGLEERLSFAARAIAKRRRYWKPPSPGIEYPVFVLPMTTLRGEPHARKMLADVVSSGGEGLVLRAPGSPYSPGRSGSMLKLKPRTETDIVVSHFVPGNGRLSGAMGALVGTEAETGIVVTVGTGFTMDQRKRHRALFPAGTVVTVSFMARTRSGALRMPVFKRVRSDP